MWDLFYVFTIKTNTLISIELESILCAYIPNIKTDVFGIEKQHLLKCIIINNYIKFCGLWWEFILVIMFGMHTLKNCVHCNQILITIHAFGDANVIVIMFSLLHFILNVFWLLLCLVDCVSSEMWCEWV